MRIPTWCLVPALVGVAVVTTGCASDPVRRTELPRGPNLGTTGAVDPTAPRGDEQTPASPGQTPVGPQPPVGPWPVPPNAPAASAPSDPSAPKLAETYTLKVGGLYCPIRCAREVREALMAVPGVENVLIDFDTKRVICHCKPGTDPNALVAALKSPYSGMLL